MKITYWLSRFCALALLALLPLAGRAQPQPHFTPMNGNVYVVLNTLTNQVLTVTGNNEYTNSQQAGCQVYNKFNYGQANQQWYISEPAYGVYVFVNRMSGQALEIGGASTANGATTNQWPYSYNNEAHQQWLVEYDNVTDENWFISNVNSGKRLMPVSGQRDRNVVQNSPGTTIATENPQRWKIIDVSTYSRVYTITNQYSGKLLTAHADDNHVAQWGNRNIASQQWVFTDAGNNEFYIADRNTRKVLEVGGSSMQPSAYVNIWTKYTSNPALAQNKTQRWRAVSATNPNGPVLSLDDVVSGMPVMFKNVNSNHYLEIGGYANQLNDDNQYANQWDQVTGANQRWTVNFVSWNRDATPTPGSPADLSSSAGQAPETVGTLATNGSLTLELYPNPASTELRVMLPGTATPASLRLTDLHGTVLPVRYQPERGSLDVRELKPGLYVLSASDGQRQYHQKFVKQ